MYSRPAILKPRMSKPFFALSSAEYVTDYYTGNMRPERLLSKSDLVIVMYYAPWSIHSQHLRHQFEVVARVLSSHKNIRFAAINCWSLNGECRKTYKLYNYPVIVAYSGSVTSVYQGEYSTDHLYRSKYLFVCILQNILFHIFFIKLFLQRMATPMGYRSFAAAGMILSTGQSGEYNYFHNIFPLLNLDETTSLAVVTNLSLAKELGFRFEGDIIMNTSTGSTTFWPSTTSRTAEKIVNWVHEQRTSPGQVRWISFNGNVELKTTQFAQYLNDSAILLMVTDSQPIYSGQEDIRIFRETANEYWTCNEDLLRKHQEQTISRKEEIIDDDMACQMVAEDIYQVDRCCRSLIPSVDWNVGCSSSAKYKWESDVTVETKTHRRSHWVEEILPTTENCKQLRNITDANVLLSRCCSLYSKIIQPSLTPAQQILVNDELRIRELRLIDKCMRKKLFEYMKYSTVKDSSIFGELELSENTTVYGTGCNHNDSLSFVILDSRHYSHFLDKWGITRTKTPIIIAIDLARELFAVMEGVLTKKRLHSFIHEYHANTVYDHMLSEEDTNSKFILTDTVEDGLMEVKRREKQEHVLTRLTQKTFNQVVENRNSSQDIVVFFSGGNWHAPSVVALYALHSTAKYFSGSESLIKFYV
uniref:Thioredoxin domain-containing protein n=1 Tax=Heterorhabditis bacteriophora TaxID=37862 RepID=A0A1I7XC55_HETBA